MFFERLAGFILVKAEHFIEANGFTIPKLSLDMGLSGFPKLIGQYRVVKNNPLIIAHSGHTLLTLFSLNSGWFIAHHFALANQFITMMSRPEIFQADNVWTVLYALQGIENLKVKEKALIHSRFIDHKLELYPSNSTCAC